MPPRITGRFRRSHAAPEEGHTPPPSPEPTYVSELEEIELTGVFAAPQWLRDLGFASWLLAGAGVVLAGLVWLMALTSTIVLPVTVAAVLAAVLAPVVGFLERKGLGRGLGTFLVFISILILGALFAFIIIRGVTSEASNLTDALSAASDKIQSAMKDAGVDPKTASDAGASASSGLSNGFQTLLHGVAKGIAGLASLAIFLSFLLLSLFFLLKDGPSIRAWVERHLGVPPPVARIVVGRTVSSMRGYFAGVTVVAAFNGIVIGLGALVVGVPNAAAIAVVNFVAAYIPYLGAWTAGAFTVLLAFGAEGSEAAIAMAIITLLANGVLQQMVQPLAMGAALGIHPLAVLIVTIAAGALFGTIGMVVAAPLTSAGVKISADLAARKRADATAGPDPPGAPPGFDPTAPTAAASS